MLSDRPLRAAPTAGAQAIIPPLSLRHALPWIIFSTKPSCVLGTMPPDKEICGLLIT
jgi:hypothetical protein